MAQNSMPRCRETPCLHSGKRDASLLVGGKEGGRTTRSWQWRINQGAPMQYVKECLQLLYWIYFKPYTLKRHVRAICPEITDPYSDNIFCRSAEARANSRLQRYDDQIWWLTVLAPIAGMFLFVPSAMILSNEPLSTIGVIERFNLAAMPFSWLLIQLVIRATRRKLAKKTAFYLMFIASLAWFLVIGKKTTFLLPTEGLSLLMFIIVAAVSFGLAIGLTSGQSLKLPADVVFGLVLASPATLATGGTIDTTLGTAVGLATGALFGVAIGVSEEITLGITLGIIGGSIISVKLGAVFGAAVAAAFILGLLRIPFWLPELLWMFFITLWPRPAAAKLPCLPPQFDQIIYFPLPFLPGLIAEAYQENQAAARQTISYLI
ncbi:hypothetical protein VU08_07710, partial [Desulfobulbus sp. F5]|nr:hypothetical protein [Desulfobulbus sp. F5]